MTVSACLVAGSALTLAVWWLVSGETSVATYSVRGSVNGITLDLGGADAEIVGGGDRPAIEVRRTDEFAFGRRAVSARDADRRRAGDPLALPARPCWTSARRAYRLTVPDNVRVTVRTTSGDVRFTGYRGSAQVDTGTRRHRRRGLLRLRAARPRAGGRRDRGRLVRARAARAALAHRRRARGRARPAATRSTPTPTTAAARVRGVTAAEDAPFQIQALSSAGDVAVEASG